MDRFNRSASDPVVRRLWRRHCPVCGTNSTAVLAPVRGTYDALIRRLLRRQAVECLACGTRLPGTVALERGQLSIGSAASNGQSFMKPRDGRSSDQLLKDLKRAESGRKIEAAVDSSPGVEPRSRG